MDVFEFNDYIEAFTKIVYRCYSKKRLMDISKLPDRVYHLFLMSALFILAFAFMTHFGAILGRKWIFYGGLIALLTGFLIMGLIVLKNVIIKVEERPTFEYLVKTELESYF